MDDEREDWDGDEVDFENTHIKVIALGENDAVSRILVTVNKEEGENVDEKE